MENKSYLLHPVAIANYIGSILFIVAGLMTWIVVPEGSLASFAKATIEDAVKPKQTFVIAIGVILLLVSAFAAWKAKKMMAILSILLLVVVLVPMASANVSGSASAETLGITKMEMGYYVAWLAWVVSFISSVATFFVYKKQA